MSERHFRILLLVFLSIIFSCLELYGENVALKKKYTMSPAPNYALSKSPNDHSELTDGKYSDGLFWTQKSSVGWSFSPRVTVEIDLGDLSDFSEITFSTAQASSADVFFPRHVFAFGSTNGKDYFYLGDLIDSFKGGTNSYEKKMFKLRDIQSIARFIRLEVISDGIYIFCDEIEVLVNRSKAFKALDVKEFIRKEDLDLKINMLINEFNQSERIKKYLRSTREYNESSLGDNLNLLVLKKNDDKRRAEYLKKQYNSDFVLQHVNPWSIVTPEDIPTKVDNHSTYNYLVPKGGSEYGGFLLTNLTDESDDYSFELENIAGTALEVFRSEFVAAKGSELVSDALVPVVDQMVTIASGQSYLFIIKANGEYLGLSENLIKVTNGNKYQRSIQVVHETFDIREQYGNRLNANNWAYFFDPMIKDNKLEAIRDLQKHHINTLVVPINALPPINETDFSKTVKYLDGVSSIDNLMIYMSFENREHKVPDNKHSFMSPIWKNDFKLWYKNLLESLDKTDFKYGNLYLYPFDEIKKEDLNDFNRFVGWLKNELPSTKVYITIDNAEILHSVIDRVDLAQITLSLINKLDPYINRNNLWLYTVNRNSRTLSPYKDYRLLAWQAFVYDIKGIGFWNYSNSRDFNYYFAPYTNSEFDYSVIYNDRNKEILSSRRWEAYSLGIQDYDILMAYRKKFGDQMAKDLARSVINNVQDISLADRVKHEMLVKLRE